MPQPSPELARTVERGDISLVTCTDCAHVYNRAFDYRRMQYAPGYENALHHSPRFRAFTQELVERLNRERPLSGAQVLELGCGDGSFLALLALRGAKCTGFDPSYEKPESGEPNGVNIVRGTGKEDLEAGSADWAVSRHVMEHLLDPVSALRSLARLGAGRADSRVYVEVPNGMATIEGLGIWDLVYEHVSYFWSGSLARALVFAGLNALSIHEKFDGQFLCAVAAESIGPTGAPKQFSVPPAIRTSLESFRKAFETKRQEWEERLRILRGENKRAVAWGAGSKGVTFLNVFREGSPIDAVVDLNPAKHGLFVAGTGEPIVAPEALLTHPPQVVIVMNPIYKSEVRERLASLSISCEILLA